MMKFTPAPKHQEHPATRSLQIGHVARVNSTVCCGIGALVMEEATGDIVRAALRLPEMLRCDMH